MKKSLYLSGAAVLAIGVALPTSSALAANGGGGDSAGRHTVAAKPQAIKSSTPKGKAKPSADTNFVVTLPLRDAKGAAAFAKSVSDPHSASYRHYVGPRTFAQRYAASPADIDAVRTWLKGQGLSVAKTPTSRTYLSVSGSARQVDEAFDTTMEEYAKGSRTFRAPSTKLTVPKKVGDKVAGVVGLDTSHRLKTFNHQVTPHAASTPGDGCSSYYGQYTVPNVDKGKAPLNKHLPTPICGYSPQQMRKARGMSAKQTGGGVKVGITLWCNDPRIFDDTNHWAKNQGFSKLKKSRYTVLAPDGGYDPQYCDDKDSGGVNVEQALDVQSIHGAAPGSDITYSAASAPLDGPLLTALHTLVDDNRVDVISNSWGGSEVDDPELNDAYDSVFMQAAAQGISVMFSSGDNGDNTNGDKSMTPPSADYPGSNPWVTSVGGTSLGLTDKSGSKVGFEQGWNSEMALETHDTWGGWAYRFGGGGGTSGLYAQPYYQKGQVPTKFSGTPAMRVYPDLSGAGDPYTGYLVGYHDGQAATGNFMMGGVGGTSWSSPWTAGTIALAQQANHGKRIGFLNPIVYGKGHASLADVKGSKISYGFLQMRNVIGGTSDSPTIVKVPATVAVNAERLQNQTLTSVGGYDNMTGLGVPSDTQAFIRGLK